MRGAKLTNAQLRQQEPVQPSGGVTTEGMRWLCNWCGHLDAQHGNADPECMVTGCKCVAYRTSRSITTEGLRDIILNGGLRLPGFDHWRERESSKPSDPDDIRWDCLCGYSGSPEKVQRHWAALLSTTPPAPATEGLREAFVRRINESIGGESAVRIIQMFDWSVNALSTIPPAPATGGLDAAIERIRSLRFPYKPDSGHSAGYENGWYDGRGAAVVALSTTPPAPKHEHYGERCEACAAEGLTPPAPLTPAHTPPRRFGPEPGMAEAARTTCEGIHEMWAGKGICQTWGRDCPDLSTTPKCEVCRPYGPCPKHDYE